MGPKPLIDCTVLQRFEDIIDGYFPLKVSLCHMMDRLSTDLAFVEINHAPIMDVPGLAHDAPVPLNIASGRAGIVHQMHLKIARGKNGVQPFGMADWRWFDGLASGPALDPMTRLAEPAFLTGFHACEVGCLPTKALLCKQSETPFATRKAALLEQLRWRACETWGPYPIKEQIHPPSCGSDVQGADFLLIETT